jgi:hypothetical protein
MKAYMVNAVAKAVVFLRRRDWSERASFRWLKILVSNINLSQNPWPPKLPLQMRG